MYPSPTPCPIPSVRPDPILWRGFSTLFDAGTDDQYSPSSSLAVDFKCPFKPGSYVRTLCDCECLLPLYLPAHSSCLVVIDTLKNDAVCLFFAHPTGPNAKKDYRMTSVPKNRTFKVLAWPIGKGKSGGSDAGLYADPLSLRDR